MKQLFFGSAALLALVAAGPVAAADMRVKAPVYKAPPAMVAAHNWTGFYFGGHGGYGVADFDGLYDSTDEDGPTFIAFGSNLDVKGAFGGAHAGYLFQSGPWVFGGEVAVSFMNWSDRTVDSGNSPPSTDHIDAKVSNLVTAVAKLGYAFNTVLVYGAIGAARADASWTVCDCDDERATGSVDLKKWGLALGGGVTVALAGPWSVGVEGMYIKFNNGKDTSQLATDSDPGDFAELKNIWIVKGKLNYKFDWGKGPVGKGPVVSKY